MPRRAACPLSRLGGRGLGRGWLCGLHEFDFPSSRKAPHPSLPPPDGGRNKVADTARGRLKPQTQFQATSSYEQATPKTSPPFFPVVLKKNKIAATTKGRLKQKSHFQTTSLYPSAKSLTLKRIIPNGQLTASRLRPAISPSLRR